MSERERWKTLGEQQPYFAVMNDARFRGKELGAMERAAFFESGDRDLADTLSVITRHLIPACRPDTTVDYGCGVGRITIPLAAISARVIAVDHSEPMLREAKRNCDERGIANVEFVRADDFLNADDSRFAADFVHSYIVLQHVPPREGLRITDTLIRRLRSDGVAALQYTHSRSASLLRRVVHPLRIRLAAVNGLVNVLQGRPWSEPMLPVYNYHVPALFETFARHRCTSIHAELIEHGSHHGAMYFFTKPGRTVARERTVL